MASSIKFLDEICEQFLTCRVCNKTFNNPKALTCLHTFCCVCLERFYETEEQQRRPYRFLLYSRAISCPVCSAKTEIPTGGITRLPDNSFLDELCQMVSRSAITNVEDKVCEICKICKERESDRSAVTKCMDCSKFLCQECTDCHKKTKVTQLHSLFKLDIEKDINCKIHQSEMIKYFCKNCDECICILCAFQHHKNHEVSLVAEVLDDGRISLNKILKECDTLIAKMNTRINDINNFKTCIKESEDKIREHATEMVSLIRQKERDLISQLKQSADPTLMDSLDKILLEDSVHKLEAASRRANTVMKGNNIEVMLAKEFIREQIDCVSTQTDFVIPQLPLTQIMERNYFFKLLEKTYINDYQCVSSSCDQFIQTDENVNYPDNSLLNDTLSKENDVTKTKGNQWQKPLPLIEVVQNSCILPAVFLKTVQNNVTKTSDAFTEMPRVLMLDKYVASPRVHVLDKETSTLSAKVMHKNVSTVSQVTVDKSTSTSSDVSIIHRAVANIKRQITVSRGTMTTFQKTDNTNMFNIGSSISPKN